jgi:hypothetical protein
VFFVSGSASVQPDPAHVRIGPHGATAYLAKQNKDAIMNKHQFELTSMPNNPNLNYQLKTIPELTEAQAAEFSAVESLKDEATKNARLNAFMSDLQSADVEAVLRKCDGNNVLETHVFGRFPLHVDRCDIINYLLREGHLAVAEPLTQIYLLNYTHAHVSGTTVALTEVQMRYEIYNELEMGWNTEVSDEDVDLGTPAFWAAANDAYLSDEDWQGLNILILDKETNEIRDYRSF